MFEMSASGYNSCSPPKSPTINHVINDSLSVNQMLPQLINISHSMLTYPLVQHCQDSVINRTKSQDMLRSNSFGAMKSGISRWSSL